MMISIVLAGACVGGVGVFIGVFLGIAGKAFYVETDPKEEAVLSVLPGNNCGGCGYAGCSGLAAAIANKTAAVDACPVGGAAVAKEIADIMGVEAAAGKRQTAFVKCQGSSEQAATEYEYYGVKDCQMLSFVPGGGPKSCKYGCLGYGSCVRACPFDAIHIVNGIAKVDEAACRACGACVSACPKELIELVPADNPSCLVACRSKDKGPVVMKVCQVGCIGCGLCVKACQVGAVTVTDFHAYIDQEKCTGCGACAAKCPKKSIVLEK